MIVDSSAIVEILKLGPATEQFLHKIARSTTSRISAGGYVEICAVIVRSGIVNGFENLDRLMADYGLEILSVDRRQAMLAREAYKEFGRGAGHRAALNFGDCFAYALAKATGDTLLFNGDDFARTDLVAA